MEANTNTNNTITFSPQLAELSDSDLLADTRRLVGASNQLLAALLAHLAEVEARGVHRTRACSSLYTYCIYELRFSEDAAFRRVSAARLLRRFPALFDAIASGELHLTALLMLGPHLTPQNFSEVLARAKHRTKKEIGRLIRELDPLPDVPPRIEPLGPAATEVLAAAPRATWQRFVLTRVRELAPGERPGDWLGAELATLATAPECDSAEHECDSAEHECDSAEHECDSAEHECDSAEHECDSARPALERVEPAREAGPVTGAQRYKVQFTATAEYVELLERAQTLLSGCKAGAALAEVHLRAMRELVSALEKRKYGVGARPRSPAPTPTKAAQALGRPHGEVGEVAEVGEVGEAPQATQVPQTTQIPQAPQAPNTPRQRGRYVPADVRREVFERDAGRCTYVDSSGQRCRETRCLELHHLQAFARGGQHQASNLTLRCRAHNALAAEQDFGREVVERSRLSARHEAFSSSIPYASSGDTAR
jgi:5-methylcytosine-specific restriction endonuclease McrA